VGEIILDIGLWGITMVPGLRTILLGKTTLFCDEFWKELQEVGAVSSVQRTDRLSIESSLQ
jgi:hypothetical protein